ncbi:glycosyltransferase [Pseudoxanthomonas mexicana]|uniref:glycosyltransferase n=1 Tax=Pseudoxanthomonas mexicana TaxID=128785 RepID=UPI0028A5CE77|nr:glycosyltransferase [Pseudoxanthomonas mexicana]
MYLGAELARLGHEVHVLAPDLAWDYGDGLPALPDTVQVHRCFAGPVNGYGAWCRRRRARMQESSGNAAAGGERATPIPHVVGELNWKGVLWHAGIDLKRWVFHSLSRFFAWVVFPDIRGEWEYWARRELRRLLETLRPDVVVSSHEPATTLRLGLLASRQGFPWVADIGDPVLAPYTPARWRRKAMRLEAEVCRRADRITVTVEAARSLFAARHGRTQGVHVVSQGFDQQRGLQAPPAAASRGGRLLELLYTGSFYSFRTGDALVEAVLATPGVRLSLATMNPPDAVTAAAARHPEAIRMLGFLPHTAVLDLQRQADVLVNIGNALPDQVPGKIFEYLGAGKPVLHLSAGGDDAGARVLTETGRGVICENDAGPLASLLARLVQSEDIAGDFGLDLSPRRVADHSWESAAARLAAVLDSARTRNAVEGGVETAAPETTP